MPGAKLHVFWAAEVHTGGTVFILGKVSSLRGRTPMSLGFTQYGLDHLALL